MSFYDSIIAHMNIRKYTESDFFNSFDGFKAFKQRIEDQLVMAGYGLLCDDEEQMLRKFYRSGESEAYVLSALGVSFN